MQGNVDAPAPVVETEAFGDFAQEIALRLDRKTLEDVRARLDRRGGDGQHERNKSSLQLGE